jgi:hypothetical protein
MAGWSLWLLLTKSCSSPSRSQCLCPVMNPFTKSPYLLSGATNSRSITNDLQGKRWRFWKIAARIRLLCHRRIAWKRGWQPSSPEPSPAATLTTSTTGHLNFHPASRNSTISPKAQGEDQGSEMAPCRYFCIVDCTYLLWLEAACIIRAPLSLRYKIRYECTWLLFCSWPP